MQQKVTELIFWNATAILESPATKISFFLSSLQKIMKRLIKRYVLKAQIDKESDEVNEGMLMNCMFISNQRIKTN